MIVWMRAAAIFAVAFVASGAWAAAHQVLHSFAPSGSDGVASLAGLTVDRAGNYYGTSSSGGAYNAGAVFELSPNESGGWTEKVLYSFQPNGRDGTSLEGGLVIDASGNLYGTTLQGGSHSYGGTAFELSPQQDGSWAETVLHSFGGGTDGFGPNSGLVSDAHGNLYGTTINGGIHGSGTAFELSLRQGGGWTETVLHSFNEVDGADGANPYSSLVSDSAGNLYGTTNYGGIHYDGTVFELAPRQGGGWTETVLHSFNFNGIDGFSPQAGLILDAAGNLYGTTQYGGIHSCVGGQGCGTIFELSPRQGGGYTEIVLHSFGNGTDGQFPYAALILDVNSNLYGTTANGGIHGYGTAFKLSPRQGGGWTETVLRSFDVTGPYGAGPYGALVLDATGNLYSTTSLGGDHAVGTIFELSPQQDGNWTIAALYSFDFNGADGANPNYGALVAESAGNLYGTTSAGGAYDGGTVFELMPNGDGTWTEKILHNFGFATDGAAPFSTLIFDSAGNLYGTTAAGGIHSGGTAFELSPSQGGGWTATILHSFGRGTDGATAEGGLVFDAHGNLYGTTFDGGIHDGTCLGGFGGCGTVFELSPRQGGGWTETVVHSFNFNVMNQDGTFPRSALVIDAAGNLYGTTFIGGIYSTGGTAFEVSPNGSGGWAKSSCIALAILKLRMAVCPSLGWFSIMRVISMVQRSTAVSITPGLRFELFPNGTGGWDERVLHSFGNGADGTFPEAGLVFDGAGNLYGATYNGGVNNTGAVFKMTPMQGGGWSETILHNFGPLFGEDGNSPLGSLILDNVGNLYGTTNAGGGPYNAGTVSEVGP